MLRGLWTLLLCSAVVPAAAEDWPRFRGPNGGGVATAEHLPVQFGPETNVVWKAALPEGHSSPIVLGNRIFLTAAEGGTRTDAGREKIVDDGGRLYTIALDRSNGEILWKQQAPRPRMERYQPTNSPASPSPVSDGERVYSFFGDYGLLAYTVQGEELWRRPLGPFNNVNGHGSSPILVDDLLILVCDQDTDSYLLALDKLTGEQRWRTERAETTRTYVTPSVYRPPSGPAELAVPGAYYLSGYSVDTGEKLWWVRGFSWQPKSTPVIADGVIYVNSVEGGGGLREDQVPTFAQKLAEMDADGDGRIDEPELKAVDPKQRFEVLDLDGDLFLGPRDWEFYRARMTSRNNLIALKAGGRGDLTGSAHVLWRLEKFLPNVPSPLVYDGVMYLVKDGGILTALDALTGDVFKQGRLRGALSKYYASPVAADGKIYAVSEDGKASVIRAGKDWEILAVNDLADDVYATPAIVGDRIYLRTRHTLYCFAR